MLLPCLRLIAVLAPEVSFWGHCRTLLPPALVPVLVPDDLGRGGGGGIAARRLQSMKPCSQPLLSWEGGGVVSFVLTGVQVVAMEP